MKPARLLRSTNTPEKSYGKKILTNYGWSSPVGVYTGEGKGYIVVCDSFGKMYLVRGTTGDVLDSMDLGGNIEASPAVYGSTIVVGTRG